MISVGILADYSDAIDACNSPRALAHIDPRPSTSPSGFALRDANGSISTTRSSTQYAGMIADARRGASAASWSQQARSGGGDAHGTSSSSCEAAVLSRQLNRGWTIHPHMAAYLAWLKQHAARPTIRRYRADIRRLMPMLGEPSQWDAAGLRSVSTTKQGDAGFGITARHDNTELYSVSGGRGICRPALLHAIPSVQRYRLSTLPRHVNPATIEQIIGACPTDRPVEVRDKAIILLLARLGLRAGDIRDMHLDDIDWRSGHLTVKGKTRRPDRLPLPQDVGDAILDYIATARPKTADPHLFVRAQAPFRSFRSSAEIAGIVARTHERGGIEGVPTGSHIFRHSLATNLLRAGAGLESVGTILRHSSPETTAIYAKVDLPMLMKIAQPWPGDRHAERTLPDTSRCIAAWGGSSRNRNDCSASTPLSLNASVTGTPECSASTTGATRQARKTWLAIGTTRSQLQPFRSCRGPRHEVPPVGVFGREAATSTPTIIEPDQVRAIMAAALNVPPMARSAHTYHYLFGLLAATGLRISEALALQCNDLVEDGLVVRNGKFGKQRLIALQPSTRQALEAYLDPAQGSGQV
jgi:integrase